MPYAMIWNTRLNVSKSGATNEAELKMGIAAKSLKAAVRFYQLAFSWLAAGTCRHTPSCSAYAVEALECHGARRGVGWRSAAFCVATPGAPPVTIRCRSQFAR